MTVCIQCGGLIDHPIWPDQVMHSRCVSAWHSARMVDATRWSKLLDLLRSHEFEVSREIGGRRTPLSADDLVTDVDAT